MSVHSARLAAGHVSSAAYTTWYTCPTGKRTIVKSVLARNRAGAANRMVIGLTVGGTLVWNYSVYGAIINTSGDSINFQPWLVMNAGDLLQLAVAADGFDVAVSGTELDL